MASERSPLLTSEKGLQNIRDDGSSQNMFVSVPPIGPHELPPPYSSLQSGSLLINCKVCNAMIDVTGKKDQHVVKCSNCNEATPIKNAPPGKKYVRCPCNCLLICKANSERIACPRTHCKRIINLAPSPLVPEAPTVPGMCQVSCAHCRELFLFNTLNNSLARCPHCRKVSSIGHFARRRGVIYLVLGVLALVLAAMIIGLTYRLLKDYYAGLIVLFLGVSLLVIFLFVQATCFLCMKVSVIEGPF